MGSTIGFERPPALDAARVQPPALVSVAHAQVVGQPAVTDAGLPAAGVLTCQQSAVITNQRTQVGRTPGVSITSGSGANGIGMASKRVSREATFGLASGVPPRGRPV